MRREKNIHHEVHEGTKKGEGNSGSTTEGTEITEKDKGGGIIVQDDPRAGTKPFATRNAYNKRIFFVPSCASW